MRRSLSSIVVLLALAAPLAAQETEPPDSRVPAPPPPGQKGTVAVNLMSAPGHFGVGFYVTDHLSLMPVLGIGYSDFSGVTYNAGADLRYDFSPDRDWSFYALGSAFYQGGQDGTYYSTPRATGRGAGAPVGYTSGGGYDGFYYGAGLGVRRRVTDRLAFMLDGRYLHTATTQVGSSFGQIRIDGQNSVVASLGLSFYLK
jgi:hypothetical protein